MPTPSTKLMQNLGVMVQLACIWEATARKPGNVHRFADFHDLHYVDFLASAAAIGGVLDKAWFRPVGEIVLEAIKATRQITTTNTNLGIVLLLSPLAAVVPGRDLHSEIPKILDGLTVADAVLVYEAIRIAQPGGLGNVAEQDIAHTPTVTLLEAMTLAESRDRIAWQYAHNFADIFDIGVPTLRHALDAGADLESAIIETYLQFLMTFEDSLIQRKHGPDAARSVLVQANLTSLVAGNLASPDQAKLTRSDWAAFDASLRARHFNPGTSADLTAASLFAALREGIIPLPYPGKWSNDKLQESGCGTPHPDS